MRTGPTNSILDIAGLGVGSAEDTAVRTGVTVILCDDPAVAAVDVRGGGPGTRETELLAPENLVHAIDAVTFSGGSVYGLAAADAIVAALGAAGRGYRIAAGLKTAPIVPGAILFDLANGGNKDWGDAPPYRDLARLALGEALGRAALRQGSVGAGCGARAGMLKGGLGSASCAVPFGGMVAAIAAVNSWGSVVMPGSRAFWAWAHEVDKEFGGARPGEPVDSWDWGLAKTDPGPREATTLAAVATDVALSPAQAKRVAIMAQDGLARAIRPAHAPFDGDIVFALSTAKRPLPEPESLSLAVLGAIAADTLARSIARGVFEATSVGGEPCWRDLS